MISSMKFLGGYKISRRKFLATPDHSYFPICIEAMKLGIHVYVEKPLVRTSYECELLMQAEQKYGAIKKLKNFSVKSGNQFNEEDFFL